MADGAWQTAAAVFVPVARPMEARERGGGGSVAMFPDRIKQVCPRGNSTAGPVETTPLVCGLPKTRKFSDNRTIGRNTMGHGKMMMGKKRVVPM